MKGKLIPIKSEILKDPLRKELASGDVDGVQKLLEAGCNPDCFWLEVQNKSALYLAIQADNVDLVNLLLRYKANPDGHSPYGEHLLIVAAKEKKWPIVEAILTHSEHDITADVKGDALCNAAWANEPESLAPRLLTRGEIGDFCVIESVGAYCSSMSAKNYNSFPEAAEVIKKSDGSLAEIRKRQTFEQIVENEVNP